MTARSLTEVSFCSVLKMKENIPHVPLLFAVTESVSEVIFAHCPILRHTIISAVEVGV